MYMDIQLKGGSDSVYDLQRLCRCLFVYRNVKFTLLSLNITTRIFNLISKRLGCLDKNIPTTQQSVILFAAVQFHE